MVDKDMEIYNNTSENWVWIGVKETLITVDLVHWCSQANLYTIKRNDMRYFAPHMGKFVTIFVVDYL